MLVASLQGQNDLDRVLNQWLRNQLKVWKNLKFFTYDAQVNINECHIIKEWINEWWGNETEEQNIHSLIILYKKKNILTISKIYNNCKCHLIIKF